MDWLSDKIFPYFLWNHKSHLSAFTAAHNRVNLKLISSLWTSDMCVFSPCQWTGTHRWKCWTLKLRTSHPLDGSVVQWRVSTTNVMILLLISNMEGVDLYFVKWIILSLLLLLLLVLLIIIVNTVTSESRHFVRLLTSDILSEFGLFHLLGMFFLMIPNFLYFLPWHIQD